MEAIAPLAAAPAGAASYLDGARGDDIHKQRVSQTGSCEVADEATQVGERSNEPNSEDLPTTNRLSAERSGGFESSEPL